MEEPEVNPYPVLSEPPKQGVVVQRPDGNTEIIITGIQDPVGTLAYMHPVIREAMNRLGIDPGKPPGRELEEMRKYFGQGSGTYLVTVDFQVARTEAFKLDDRAQKKIAQALKAKRRKRTTSKRAVARKRVRRSK